MSPRHTPRRALIIGLGVCLLLLFLGLATLNAFNLSILNPSSGRQTLVFIALSTIAFLLFVGVLVLLVRNVLKLYADQRSRVLGVRLRTRMLGGAVLVSLVPLVFMFAFSYLLMNRAQERWFSQPVARMQQDSSQLADEMQRYITSNARSEADSIAIPLSSLPAPLTAQAASQELSRHEATLQGGFALVYRDNIPVASLHLPLKSSQVGGVKPLPIQTPVTEDTPTPDHTAQSVPLPGPVPDSILEVAQRNDGSIYSLGGKDYVLATAALRGGVAVVGLPIPVDIAAQVQSIRSAGHDYQVMFHSRRQVRNLYMLLLLLTTALALFAICWLALNLSKQVTRPVESLADAMEAIAAGDYAHRVGTSATEELGELADSFNAMAADLESARVAADYSNAQLFELNTVLRARRSELETLIETIPNGVVTLSPGKTILIANRAFSEMLDPGGEQVFVGSRLNTVFPAELLEVLDGLMRRAHRMGTASAEMQVPLQTRMLHLSATVALLETRLTSPREHLGYLLVLEDVSQLLHAQKQSAWKEVARRVAHEIKNPLTPISLNAELIQRHIQRLTPVLAEHDVDARSLDVMQRSTETIIASVETLRSLVNQFSALAEFPSARPQPADLNTIVNAAMQLFSGRLDDISTTLVLARDLPPVMADPDALKRALTHLIDNAAEAMHESLLRELRLSTRIVPSGMVELIVADSGGG
ncbi:MAG: HAMP domain-containing protein, partial [Bryocella sp.]